MCYDYSKFDSKITICCIYHIRIQFKIISKEETLKNSATESLAQEFWISYRLLLQFQKINSWASDSLLAAQIFITWPRSYFIWHASPVKTGVRLAHCFSVIITMKYNYYFDVMPSSKMFFTIRVKIMKQLFLIIMISTNLPGVF